MSPELISKHQANIRTMYNRLSVEQDIPLNVAKAMIAQANIVHKLLNLMKLQGMSEDNLMIIGQTFLGSWVMLGESLNLPAKRLGEAAVVSLELVADGKKAFVDAAVAELKKSTPSEP